MRSDPNLHEWAQAPAARCRDLARERKVCALHDEDRKVTCGRAAIATQRADQFRGRANRSPEAGPILSAKCDGPGLALAALPECGSGRAPNGETYVGTPLVLEAVAF